MALEASRTRGDVWTNKDVSDEKELSAPTFVGEAFWDEELTRTKSLRHE